MARSEIEVHWFDQHAGQWPYLSCGRKIDNPTGPEWSLWIHRVTCRICRFAVEHHLDTLASPLSRPSNRAPLPGLPPVALHRQSTVGEDRPEANRRSGKRL